MNHYENDDVTREKDKRAIEEFSRSIHADFMNGAFRGNYHVRLRRNSRQCSWRCKSCKQRSQARSLRHFRRCYRRTRRGRRIRRNRPHIIHVGLLQSNCNPQRVCSGRIAAGSCHVSTRICVEVVLELPEFELLVELPPPQAFINSSVSIRTVETAHHRRTGFRFIEMPPSASLKWIARRQMAATVDSFPQTGS